ncbi:DNA methylase [Pseudomonas shirazensis]|uniref:DNA methylase n=1 Tax=Pseudomonas shirazensis TaxID=2745494 RepID=UPI003D2B6C96
MEVSAESLGIDVNHDPAGWYKWLLASFLVGKRIRSSVALAAYHALVIGIGLDTPAKLASCPHRTLVRQLGSAGYARYDESTARRLHALGCRLQSEMADYLNPDVNVDTARLSHWLLGFDGIGPKTLEIFMRELHCAQR